jgi:hypothetical protein
MVKVIVTLTTVPDRLNVSLPATIKSISASSYEDFEIHLNLPRTQKTTGINYETPSWANEFSKLKVFTGLEDIGPKTKIIPTLLRVEDPEAIIITADDDIVYHRDMIKYHIDAREIYSDYAIGFSGTKAGRLYITPKGDVEVDILDNYKTASYKRSMFGDDFFSQYAHQSWNDDLVISAYFRDKKIPKIVMAYDKETFFVPRVKSFPIINIADNPMTGCDLIRGHANKTSSPDLQIEYDAIIPA